MAKAKKQQESGKPETQLTDLPNLLANSAEWLPLRAALEQRHSGGIDGAWGSSAALAVCALRTHLTVPVFVVVPNLTDVPIWAEDIFTFCGEKPTVFPAHETWPVVQRAGKITQETAQRLRVLQQLGTATAPNFILAPMAAVVQPVPRRDDLDQRGRRLCVGEVVDPEELTTWLLSVGYQRCDAVEAPGEMGRRGGILDLFPPDAHDPLRLEFFGDELESIRTFSTTTQRSLEQKTDAFILGLSVSPGRRENGFVLDDFPKDTIVVLVEPEELQEQGRHFFDRIADVTGLYTVSGAFAQLLEHISVTVSSLPRSSVEATAHLKVESIERFSGQVQRVQQELDSFAQHDRVWIACQTDAEVQRLTEVLKAGQLAESQRLRLVTGHVRSGFRLVPQQTIILGSHQIFHRELLPAGAKSTVPSMASRRIESRAIDSFLDLNDGDYVVHIMHGIARFRGMKMLEKGNSNQERQRDSISDEPEELNPLAFEEFLILEFRNGVFLYVPATRIDLIQRYVGGANSQPELSKLGSTAWGKKKAKVAEALIDMAAEMIQLQAVRATLPGFSYPIDSDWQREFEGTFPYQETPDQATAIEDIKKDLERPKPMDRLLCGDVGYGKTEVAVRAAFKVIDNGKQVAVLVPTTVLAEQHYRTFSQRLAEYPFRVECLSRFRSSARQKEIVKQLKEGSIDIVIGTHRLVSQGVQFKDLGLVVIDEEQRFGVEHKDRLKRLRTSVHILTMTATPIPRTLHSALLGIREISSLETPPPGRFPVETRIIRWDDAMIKQAIHREFNRGGQVYFVHNRVHDIHDIAAKLKWIVPDAKIVVGHGQMAEGELEKAMVKFVQKEADILVATTIIESGLDIPNANTIFIDDADMYGLADLHQLRGRVGRTQLRAYAYLIVNPIKLVSPNAQKRLKAIEEFTELGSGFKIAMRDLEIRGAGNILGNEQSGHIAAVGYEMYCQLLENAIRQLKHQPPRVAVEVNVDLPWPAFLPRDYVPGQKLRIEMYRRMSRLRDPKKLIDFRQEMRDLYGPHPEPVEWLLRTTEVRLLCVRWQISSLHRDGKDLVFTYRNRKKADNLAQQSQKRLKVVDEKCLYLRLRAEEGEEAPEVMYSLIIRVLQGHRSDNAVAVPQAILPASPGASAKSP